MKIVEVSTNKEVMVEVRPIEKSDFKLVTKKKGWQFNWRLEREREREVYKLVSIDDPKQIFGLISLHTNVENRYIHINLLEAAKGNVGRTKKYDRIAGCLFAFACELSFVRGFDGYIALLPKTQLRDYYLKKYRMLPFGYHIGTGMDGAIWLINEYSEND